MSASLVGSEMCIRDRGKGKRTALSRGDVPSTPTPDEGRRPQPPRGRAVSYTHLTLPTICSV
eukprot:13751245-Alexandrium_andersonii.AAC.1